MCKHYKDTIAMNKKIYITPELNTVLLNMQPLLSISSNSDAEPGSQSENGDDDIEGGRSRGFEGQIWED